MNFFCSSWSRYNTDEQLYSNLGLEIVEARTAVSLGPGSQGQIDAEARHRNYNPGVIAMEEQRSVQ